MLTMLSHTRTGIRDIPKGWELVRLGEVISLEYGKGLSEKKRRVGPFPVIGSNGIIGFHSQSLIQGPGIVVGRKGSIGAVSWVGLDFWPIDTTYYVAVLRKDIDLKWLYFSLVKLNLPRLGQADVVPGLKRDLVHILMFPFPPLPEQKKIAEILSTVDQAIEKVGEAIEKTQRLKKGLMQELLTKGIGHKEFKKALIGKLPKVWDVRKLAEVGNLQYGYTASAIKQSEGVRFVRITDIDDNGKIKWAFVPSCKIDNRNYLRYKLNEGDVLFARIGATTGKSALIDKEVEGVYASYLIRFVRNVNTLDSRYLYFFTQSNNYWLQVHKNKEGQLKKGINAKILGSLSIPLPPLPEQQKIAEILSSVDRRIDVLTNRRERLEKIKKGLMEDLLTGKKRVMLEA